MEEKDEQSEHQAVVEEPDTEEDWNEETEEGDEEGTEDETTTVEAVEEPTGRQQAVALVHKPKETIEPPKPIKLSPTREQLDAWRNVIAVMQALGIDEATFQYNGNLSVRAMDPSRVSMVDAQIDIELGLSQLAQTPQPVTRKFTCTLAELSRALRMDKPTIDIGENEAVFLGDKDYHGRAPRVTVPVLESGEEEIPEPKLTLDITSDLDLEDVFTKMKKYMTTIPDHLSLVSDDKNNLTVKGAADSLQTFEMSGFKPSGPGKATFATSLLKALSKDRWDIVYANDMPLKATRNITKSDYVGTGKDMKQVTTIVAQLKVYFAPRIETE
jgi:hypothetical protein